MKEFRFKIFIIVAASLLCLYLLYPTYVDYQNTKTINKALAPVHTGAADCPIKFSAALRS